MDTLPASAAPLENPAPAPAVVATPESSAAPGARVGFLARLVGAESTITDLQSRLTAEATAHAACLADLTAARARIAEFEALESQLEAQVTQATAAVATAQAEVAAVPHRIAAGVAAVVETLGVPESTLAPVQPEPPAQGAEFSHLHGRERAAAAFKAQFATA